MYFTLMYFTLCTMLCSLDSACIVPCVLDPMYFSKGLLTEEPFAMLSGKHIRVGCQKTEPQLKFYLTEDQRLLTIQGAASSPYILPASLRMRAFF